MRTFARALLVLLLLAGSALGEARRFVIFHTSDIHGGMEPRDGVGGFAALAAVIRKETLPYVLLDSGDLFQGTPEGSLTKGDAVLAVMNRMGYRAAAIGNHEYDYGEDNLRRLVRKARFPLLAANIIRRADQQPVDYARPTAMLVVGGVRLGVVGLATRTTATSTLPANVAHLRFLEEAPIARDRARALRAEGAEVVVALSHCGLAPSLARQAVTGDVKLTDEDIAYRGDLAIARAAPVDLVLGGHMHTALPRPFVDPQSGVPIVQSGAHLRAVTRLEVVVEDGKVTITGRLIPLRVAEVGSAKDIARLVGSFRKRIGRSLEAVVGRAAADLHRHAAGGCLDSPMGNWFTDAMARAAKAPIALQNSFGIRADLRAGPITRRAIFEIMPFENTLVVVTLTGTELETLLRRNLGKGAAKVQVSGVEATLTGAKLTITHHGAPLAADRRYPVAVNSYMSGGGSCCQDLPARPARDTGQNLRDVLTDAVKRGSPVRPPATCRIRRAGP